MVREPCQTCRDRGGLVGPCDDCGALPIVPLVGANDDAPGEERSVTTGVGGRRVVLVVAGVVVALLTLNLVWQAGADDRDADAAGEGADESVEPSTTTTTRPRPSVPTTVPAPPVLVEPVEGSEDRWLIVVEGTNQDVWQVPLGGGEIVRLGRLNQGSFPVALSGDHLISYEGGQSLRDGSTWGAARQGEGGGGSIGGAWAWVVGVTADGEVVTYDEQSFAIHSADGELREAHAAPPDLPLGSYPRAVAGRTVIYEGPHGLLAFHLDDRRLERIAVGSFISAAGERLIAETCDERLTCSVGVIDVATGRSLASLRGSIVSDPWSGWGTQGVSPDGDRLITLDGSAARVVDLSSGQEVSEARLPESLLDVLDDTSFGAPRALQVIWTPDSSRAFLFAGGHVGIEFVGVMVRDGDVIQPIAGLVDPVRRLSGPSGSRIMFLADREYEPWAP